MKLSTNKKIMGSAVLAGLMLSSAAFAAVTPEEADQLGKNLTLFGAEKAGNKEGTIPAYDPLPKNFTVPGWDQANGRYTPGPYDDEKPLYTITSANLDKYKNGLAEGHLGMFRRYPDFRMNVYKTHRSTPWSEWTLSHCKKNALNAKLAPSKEAFSNSYGCVPFPIPKSGYEVMWNFVTRPVFGYQGTFKWPGHVVSAQGNLIQVADLLMYQIHPFQNPNATEPPKTEGNLERRMTILTGPPSLAGVVTLLWMPSDYDKDDFRSWLYSPGTRRVRLAPENKYDTPNARMSGAVTVDEINGFDGNMDRFDFSPMVKREMYVQYNANSFYFGPIQKLAATKGFLNPDLNRWELHRVWVVDAKLKPGKRHRDSRRVLYFDEDSWSLMMVEYYDQSGKMHRVNYGTFVAMPEHQLFSYLNNNVNDLLKGEYFLTGPNGPNSFVKILPDTPDKGLSPFTPAVIQSYAIR